MAWPESLLPVESDGESVLDELDELESLVAALLEVVVLGLAWSAAYAAMPTPRVPARLAAISAPVITVVRLSPWSRSIFVPS